MPRLVHRHKWKWLTVRAGACACGATIEITSTDELYGYIVKRAPRGV